MNTATHVMFDLETMDTAVTTAFLSVGAVCFFEGDTHVGSKEYLVFNIDDQLKKNRTVSGRTMAWWIEQEHAAQRVVGESAQAGLSLRDGLLTIDGFLHQVAGPTDDLYVWGNGANFDISILEHAYHSLGMQTPWHYWNVRCYRTLKNLFPHIERPSMTGLTKHNALDDATLQARHAQLILQEIRKCDRPLLESPAELVAARTQ